MIFVLEIKGTAALAFEADDMDDARAFAEDTDELEDLTELTSNGAPLWNGKDDISVRAATQDETDLFEEERGEDWEEEPHADAEDFIVYLVPLDEPDED
ncbi:MAG: hypothetical protein ABSD74_15315 [Rhizomicrobium sp.]|jgi:hypothetical protein